MRLVNIIKAGVLAFVVILGACVFVPRFYNNWLLARFENSVKNLPFEVVATEKRIGVLWGGGNHCDMQVLALIDSDLDPADFHALIQNLVSDIRYPFDVPGYPSVLVCENEELFLLDDAGMRYLVLENGQVEEVEFLLDVRERAVIDRLRKTGDPKTRYYLVIYSDQAYSGFSMGDFRAH